MREQGRTSPVNRGRSSRRRNAAVLSTFFLCLITAHTLGSGVQWRTTIFVSALTFYSRQVAVEAEQLVYHSGWVAKVIQVEHDYCIIASWEYSIQGSDISHFRCKGHHGSFEHSLHGREGKALSFKLSDLVF